MLDRIDFSHSFANKMLVLSITIAMVISVAMPLTYYLLMSQERERDSAVNGEFMADKLAGAIKDYGERWKLEIPRIIEIRNRVLIKEQLVGIQIFEPDGTLLFEEIHRPAAYVVYNTRTPIRVDSQIKGYLHIQESKLNLLINCALALLCFSSLGGLLGTIIYRYPLKMVTSAEGNAMRVVDELKSSRETMRKISITDSKTQLFNAAYLKAKLSEAIDYASILNSPLQLAMLDIDHFKKYNDRFGHVAGDEILAQIAAVLKINVRAADIIGRFGGEEFMLILPNTELKVAEFIVNRIKDAIANHVFEGEETLPGGNLTISIGLASNFKGLSLPELTNMADKALYAAKEAGRNQVCVFSDGEYFINGIKLARISEITFTSQRFVDMIQTINDEKSENFLGPQVKTLLSFLKTLDSRESATAQHSFMVNKIAMAIGRKMELPEKELLQLNWGTLLHDIGKLGISDSILMKPAGLTVDEHETIKRHPLVGFELVKNNDYLTTAAQIVLYHQERWDGGGYPYGLKGDHIPLLARICSVADTVAAMAEDRPYRKAAMMDEIIWELQQNADIQFDPEIVDVFVKLQSKTEVIYDALEQALAQPGFA